MTIIDPQQKRIDVAIVEDNKVVRESLQVLINGTTGYRCIHTFSAAEKLMIDLPHLELDTILMDISLPGISGIECVRKIRNSIPQTSIIMMTVFDDADNIFEALRAGANGYLLKQTAPSKVLEAILEAKNGGSPMNSKIATKVISYFKDDSSKSQESGDEKLTKREREILSALSKGNSYQEIADLLNMSIGTLRYHIRNIYQKLQVHSQSEAVAKGIKGKII